MRTRLAASLLAAAALVSGCGSSGTHLGAERSAASTTPQATTPAQGTISYGCPPASSVGSTSEAVCTVTGVGSDPRPLVTVGPTDAGPPSLSPDGTHVAYALAGGGGYQLTNTGVYLAARDGSGPTRIWTPPAVPGGSRTNYFALPSTPAWSPDGQEVAVTEPTADPTLNNRDCDLWVIPLSGHGAHRVTDGSGRPVHCAAPSVTWSPDGTTLAYVDADTPSPAMGGGDEVMTVPVAGGRPHQIGRQPGQVLVSLAWSPAGGRIAVVAEGTDVVGQQLPGYPARVGDDPDLVELFPAGGGAPTTVVHTPPAMTGLTMFGTVVWSPDGTRLALGRRSFGLVPKAEPGGPLLPEPAGPATSDVVTVDARGGTEATVATGAAGGATGRGPDITGWVRSAG